MGAPEHQNFRQNAHDVDGSPSAEQTRLAVNKALSDRYTGQTVIMVSDMHLEADYNLKFAIEIAKQTGRPIALELFKGEEAQNMLDDFSSGKIERTEFMDYFSGQLSSSDTPFKSSMHFYTGIERGNAYFGQIVDAIQDGVKFYAADPDHTKNNEHVAEYLREIAQDNNQGLVVLYGQDHTIATGLSNGGGRDMDQMFRDLGLDVLIFDPERRSAPQCSIFMIDFVRKHGGTKEQCEESVETRLTQIDQEAIEDQDPERYKVDTKTGETKPVGETPAAERKPAAPVTAPVAAGSS